MYDSEKVRQIWLLQILHEELHKCFIEREKNEGKELEIRGR